MGSWSEAEQDAIRSALRSEQTIDITTTGRRSGLPRRIEIWFCDVDGEIIITGTVSDHDPGTTYPRDWLANLAGDPMLTFHLKQSIHADLPAEAEIVRDPERRRRLLSAPATRWYREQGESIDDLVAGAPLVSIRFVGDAAWLNE
ncbi:MAG: nitroreductase/quinone reductase family protein [Actinomycetota bacterium]